jgi:radical SAM protein with 4Fe4S-binding SPASM domain
MREMRDFCSKFIGPPGERLFSCGAGLGGGCVDAYGRFQPCLLLRHPDTGYDLHHGTLKQALTGFFAPLREMMAQDVDYLRRCARCFLKGLCDQCPARSWMEHGALDKRVEYLCDVAHVRARHLGLLKEGERAWEVSDGEARVKALG